jgi:hypothetical protein
MNNLLKKLPDVKAQLLMAVARIETAEALIAVNEHDRATDVAAAAIAYVRIWSQIDFGRRP